MLKALARGVSVKSPSISDSSTVRYRPIIAKLELFGNNSSNSNGKAAMWLDLLLHEGK
jgi:hypothetical protein